LIKLGMSSSEVLARFAAERQALALMDHASVARIFESGATESGQPFFAMELVDGLAITQHADKHRLSTRQRIELFLQVCHAVQHAHGKGVIHRDLKPANILVAEVDGQAIPKVIDFGIAKATERGLTADSLHTELGRMIGTPEYMSPEQAGSSGADVDIRTDVYSLGVLLYELLCGSTPFARHQLRKANYAEVLRVIQEVDPPRLSSALADRLDPAHDDRGSEDLRARKRALAGDLEWITAKALEKDRSRRYETASELAADLERFLANEPVSARQPTASYRLRKFVRRNRLMTTALASIAAALLIAVFGILWGLLRAQGEVERSQAAVRLLGEVLEIANPDVTNNRAATLAILARVETGVDVVLTGDVNIEQLVRRTMGTTYWGLGELVPAVEQLSVAYALAKRNPATSAIELHEILWAYSWVQWQTGRTEPLGLWQEQCLQVTDVFLGETDEGVPKKTRDRVRRLTWLVLNSQRRKIAAADYLACEPQVAKGAEPSALLVWRAYADWLVACGDGASLQQKDHAVGRELVQQAINIYQEACRLTESNSRIALANEMLLEIADRAGKHEEVISLAKDALERSVRALGPSHWFPEIFRAWLGSSLVRTEKYKEAVPHLVASTSVLRRVLGPTNHLIRVALTDLVNAYLHLGETENHQKQREILIELMQEAAERNTGPQTAAEARAVFLPEHPDLATAIERLLQHRGPPGEAIPQLDELIRFGKKLGTTDSRRQQLLASTLAWWQTFRGAQMDIPMRERLLAFCLDAQRDIPRAMGFVHFERARAAWHTEDYERACELHRLALQAFERTAYYKQGAHWWGIVARMGASESRCGRHDLGLKLMMEASRELEPLMSPHSPLSIWTLQQIARASLLSERFAEFAPFLRERYERLLPVEDWPTAPSAASWIVITLARQQCGDLSGADVAWLEVRRGLPSEPGDDVLWLLEVAKRAGYVR
jgi:tetratricopeptide (TPR) repeat protein